MNFSERLRDLRIRKGLLQKQVATAIGVSEGHYIKYETRNSNPTLENIISLADLFNVTIDYLVGRIETSLSPEEIDQLFQNSKVCNLQTDRKSDFNPALFAKRLKELREEKGLTQSQLGKQAGMVKSVISLMENGHQTTTLENTVKLASIFGVSVDYLLGVSEERGR